MVTRSLSVLIAGLLLGAFACPTPSAQANEAYSWTGFYFGGQIGRGGATLDGVVDSADLPAFQGRADRLDLDGLAFGGHAGYNMQYGMWIVGVEGDINWLDAKDSVEDAGGAAPRDFIEGDIERLATLRGRAGFATGRALLFVTAGVAFVDAKFTSVNEPDNPEIGVINFDDVGFVMGGGLEYAVTNSVRARIQGLHYNFGDRQDASNLTSDSVPADFVELEDAYTVSVGVSISLWPPPASP